MFLINFFQFKMDDEDYVCTDFVFGFILFFLISLLIISWLYLIRFDYYRIKRNIENEVKEEELRKRTTLEKTVSTEVDSKTAI